ncbi:MAG: acyl carrier protein [Flavobacteriales bacterium CG18_big_fil_WC_8_21_14_2_50_32_9]|nr:acyl carrier protein [Flavobacteriales bacterium]PIQ15591.1 MAG: acyl carrier protein [Flavobacteriales bacterium CG18_big_fil_WC_8_21_14_2_50_32_9]
MNIQELIEKLEEEIEEVEQGTLLPSTNIRNIDWWSSMHALVIIAFVDIEYNVQVSGKDLKEIQTIQDLYDLIVKKS